MSICTAKYVLVAPVIVDEHKASILHNDVIVKFFYHRWAVRNFFCFIPAKYIDLRKFKLAECVLILRRVRIDFNRLFLTLSDNCFCLVIYGRLFKYYI